jgi:glucose/arabinose dehydrogenase
VPSATKGKLGQVDMHRINLLATLLVLTLSSICCSPQKEVTGSHTLPLGTMQIVHAFPKISYSRMVHLTHPGDGTNRLFLVLQPGQIIVFPNDEEATPQLTFLDISTRVNNKGNEEGLLGLAFDPKYATNGFFYVYYSTASPRRSVISRFSVSGKDPNQADPTSELIIIEVSQPFKNHNGGHLAFGPDGHLYVGLGDGGSAGDPYGNSQNLATLLGSILRIDVATASPEHPYRIPSDNPFVGHDDNVREEIWAYGLRNPWRFNFDPVTGYLWAGDVGQNKYEEINIIQPGLNYGWNILEGFHCYLSSNEPCEYDGFESPIIEYSQKSSGCSVTGGYVYRGSRLAYLSGAYIYGDFCSGKIWSLRYDGTQITEHVEIADSAISISAFGEDANGEIYILSFDKKIYQMEIVP